MEKKPVNSATRSLATQLLFLISSILYACALATSQELLIGFKASPSSSVSSFQSLLNDSTSTFSLGFFRANQTQLALTVVHLPSLQPLWQANPTSSFRWSDKTQLFFNGSLERPNKVTKLFSSTPQTCKFCKNNKFCGKVSTFPQVPSSRTRAFTSNMSLVSSNGLYSMRLGVDFMALYANFKDGKTQQMYWKHKALEAKAEVVQGQGPIHARLESDGFLGMYQIGKTPVDIQPFNSFHRPIDTFLVLRLEPDGNLKGYYWAQTDWVLDYQAITETCGHRGHFSALTGDDQSGDFCSGSDDFWAIRRKGVELPFKELMGSDTKSSSVEECELSCHGNCSCWGAVYNNVTGFCYLVDYPIQTLVGVGDESKIGYFKAIRSGIGEEHGLNGSWRRTPRGQWGLTLGEIKRCALAINWSTYFAFGAHQNIHVGEKLQNVSGMLPSSLFTDLLSSTRDRGYSCYTPP
ncbi:hypothetical protein OIU79_005379 [Salix purpurea]|uniref:Apple domain-containing protein n=1 Tax=Salix purpurea TaxID=77065 RepID=A0A9Q0UCK1_SALPP|nr:hypothetical protein OIU79_005379 [Salix purpurea]